MTDDGRPPTANSPLMSFIKKILRRLRAIQLLRRARRRLNRLWHSPRLLGEGYSLPGVSEVTLFTDQTDLFPGYQPRAPIHGRPRLRRVTVTLIATTFNEGANARRVLDSILAQTRLPDEMIIVDGGSQDDTLETLRAARTQFPLKVIVEPQANIARGRNLAIAAASHPIIAAADFGSRLRADWLETLIAPFEIEPAIEVSAGWFEAVANGQPVRRMGWASLAGLDPRQFLPSSRSLAFTQEAWERVGGYPEWLTLTGEDTYFALELKNSAAHWAFAPNAVVEWDAPLTPLAYWRKLTAWAIGDGEAGLDTKTYRRGLIKTLAGLAGISVTGGLILASGLYPSPALAWALILWLAAAACLLFVKSRRAGYSLADFVWETPIHTVKTLGFLKGLRRREEVTRRRFRTVKGVCFMFSGVPVDDTGGGARCTQITLELLRRGWLVVFLNKFPKYETVDLNLRIRHPNLLTAPLERFSLAGFWQAYAQALAGKVKFALVEFPLKDILPLIQGLREAGASVVYDLLDDWDTALGGQWYTPETERAVIAASRALVATAPSLAARLRKLSARPVTLLPNAVNSYLFNPQRRYPAPADLPAAEWRAIYVGALWGEWFDWELLTRLALAYPGAAIVVIGDYAGQCPHPPPNLHFLGLKAQRDLPAYLAHSAVAILPWKVNNITQATSPLKVYEYLAMRKPVVAPDILPLRGLPGVTLAADSADFIAQVGAARTRALPKAELAGFIAQNDWAARVDALLRLI